VDRHVSPTAEVIARHLDAVRSGDPAAMAADYADDAVLDRPDASFRGREAIEAYFRTVPHRLGDGTVTFGETEVNGDTAIIHWRIVGGPGDGASGHDTCIVRDGVIVHQSVQFEATGF
jgi:ketosteroid isomerase-like protein